MFGTHSAHRERPGRRSPHPPRAGAGTAARRFQPLRLRREGSWAHNPCGLLPLAARGYPPHCCSWTGAGRPRSCRPHEDREGSAVVIGAGTVIAASPRPVGSARVCFVAVVPGLMGALGCLSRSMAIGNQLRAPACPLPARSGPYPGRSDFRERVPSRITQRGEAVVRCAASSCMSWVSRSLPACLRSSCLWGRLA